MKVVVDTNVVIAALLRDSVVRRILSSGEITFLLPEFALNEVSKHKKSLAEKSGLDDYQIEAVLSAVLENVDIISGKRIKKSMAEAQDIMRQIDIKDAPFIALALTTGSDGIFSFDRHFKKQKKVRIFSSSELLEYISPD